MPVVARIFAGLVPVASEAGASATPSPTMTFEARARGSRRAPDRRSVPEAAPGRCVTERRSVDGAVRRGGLRDPTGPRRSAPVPTGRVDDGGSMAVLQDRA